MITQQELAGHWDQVKGRVKQRWGQLTDDDLRHLEGSADELVGIIEEKTGESRREIEDFLEGVLADGGNIAQQAAERARQFAGNASAAAHQQYDHVAAQFQSGYRDAEGVVRRNPLESVAVSFGAGIITGVVLGLTLRSR